MRLKQLLATGTLIYLVLAIGLTAFNSMVIHRKVEQHYDAITDQLITSAFEVYKDEILGNVLIGDQEVLSALLKEISIERNMVLVLRAGNFVLQQGGKQSDYIKHFNLMSGSTNVGTLDIATVDKGQISFLGLELLIIALAELVLLWLGFYLLNKTFSKRLFSPLSALGNNMREGRIDQIQLDASALKEVQELAETILVMNEKMKKSAESEALGKVAAQVSHDIRSPLAALEMVSHMTEDLPEDLRIMIRSATSRISDIANDLLKKYKARSMNLPSIGAEATSDIYLVSTIIDGIVSEKRIQYRGISGIQLEAHCNQDSYGIFMQAAAGEFKRMLSNLINNAVESLQGDGVVEVQLNTQVEGRFEIKIADNGMGIPAEIIDKINRGLVISGKDHGHGLGLLHARNLITSMGGALQIKSVVGKGTELSLILNRAPIPEWFVPKISLGSRRHVVVIDDDKSIHHVWEGRFEKIPNFYERLNVIHFTGTDECIQWLESHDIDENCFFLVDYELIGSSINGLDLIQRYGLETQSILVTSRFEEPSVLSRCTKLGVPLIPKGMSNIVPIEIGDNI